MDAQNDRLRIKHQTVPAYIELSKTYRAFENPAIFLNAALCFPENCDLVERWVELNFSLGSFRNSLCEIKGTVDQNGSLISASQK